MQDLRSKFLAAAREWAEANDAPQSRLGKLVKKDADFVPRVEAADYLPCTVSTLEEFARFLADPANWPEGEVGDEAKALAHVVGVSLPEAALSAGKLEDISRSERAA